MKENTEHYQLSVQQAEIYTLLLEVETLYQLFIDRLREKYPSAVLSVEIDEIQLYDQAKLDGIEEIHTEKDIYSYGCSWANKGIIASDSNSIHLIPSIKIKFNK